MEWLAGSGEKAAAARLFSSQRGGQQHRHRFGSVNVSQRANIPRVSLRNCKLRTHWAMHDPAGAGLHRQQQLLLQIQRQSCVWLGPSVVSSLKCGESRVKREQ